MKCAVQLEIDPSTETEVSVPPAKIQEWVGKWQELNPIGMYF